MVLVGIIRALFICIVLVSATPLAQRDHLQQFNDNYKRITIDQMGEICIKLSRDPYFDNNMVIGNPWRIYYTWNMKLDDKCLEMTFKNATPEIVKRIYIDMNEYLETQPYWNAAALLVSMGHLQHEMLLFADQGAEGRFVGVPNVMKDGRSMTPVKKGIQLFRLHLKLLYGGKYLIISDCNIGVTTLSIRQTRRPRYRAEIQGVANNLALGNGSPACVGEINDDETMGVMALEDQTQTK